ncbi:type II secretion system F family protein [Natronoarchaeum sp. GCM10025321]|uniref:type II secretion system F family protein n=2 Tax=unclassified Natronoarchaeum TaxID=2620183 RepID=UPI003618C0AD
MEVYPLLVLLAVLTVPAMLAGITDQGNRIVTRLSVVLFADRLELDGAKRLRHERRLRQAQFPTTYRIYAVKTALYAVLGGVAGVALGLYAGVAIGGFLTMSPAAVESAVPAALQFLDAFAGLPPLTTVQWFALLVGSCLVGGATAAGLVYWLRWWYPASVATTRRGRIEANLPQAVAFMYALSRSGMELPEVMRILSETEHVYGAAAEEFSVGVRHMDLFGKDVVTAIQTMGKQTPSPQFKEFCGNLASVLQSGQSLSEYLETEHESFKEEAEAQQERLLNELATLAEVYVTVLVAGPLFLITILVVIGIAVTDTLGFLRLFVYLLLPAANLGFMLYLSTVMSERSQQDPVEGLVESFDRLSGVRRSGDDTVRSDGGRAASRAGQRDENLTNLALYKRLQWFRDRLSQPVRTAIDRPETVLWVTVPLVVVLTILRLYWTVSLGVPIQVVLDDILIQSTLFVVGTFALVYEVHRRRIEAIEAVVPDLMDRLASVNEAGMTVIESIGRVRGSELGALDDELDRVWADIQWGANVTTALRRFESRVRTKTISRTVTLITHAMNASGDLARVLRIAAGQAKADRRLKRARAQEMLTYVVVVYVAFGVFLVIIAALDLVLLPSLPDSAVLPESTGSAGQVGLGGVLGELGSVNETAYTLVFFHTTAMQAVFSGLIAGQMSGGSIKDGAKHAAILLSIAYLVFLFL